MDSRAFTTVELAFTFFPILVEKIGNRDYVLTIMKASLEDDAEYSMTAKNIAGQTCFSFPLISI